jgi:hypothetical protein
VDPVPEKTLLRWAESLSGVARTGLGFTESQYERERFEEVLKIAGDMKAAAESGLDGVLDADGYVAEWMKDVGSGVAGYQTPKVERKGRTTPHPASGLRVLALSDRLV